MHASSCILAAYFGQTDLADTQATEMKNMTKQSYAYRLFNNGPRSDSREYANLTLELMIGTVIDSAAEYSNQSNREYAEHYIDRMRKIREQSDSTKYFAANDRRINLQWLAAESSFRDYETEWFALKVENSAFDPEMARLLTRIVKATNGRNEDSSPALILSILHKMKFGRVEYARDVYDAWLIRPEATCADIAIPWSAQSADCTN